MSLEGRSVSGLPCVREQKPALRRYVPLTAVLAFIGAGIWWRGSGEPATMGLVLLYVAIGVLVAAVTVTWWAGRR